jgi:agmatine deiminase
MKSLNLSSLQNSSHAEFQESETALFLVSTSYLNFLITDHIILVPKYWRIGLDDKIKEKDKQAVQILQEVFPEREIRQIDVFNLNLCGGGIHCLTQHEPKVN